MNDLMYNYRTSEYEPLDESTCDYSCYLPQITSAQGLYECHVLKGMRPIDAFKEVMEKIVSV